MSASDLHLLRPAIEAALAVARQGEADDPPVPAPPVLRPFLSFARLPAAALAVARRVLDDDESFRARVRAATSQADVGPVGWLWLDRPEGWDVAVAEAAGATAPLSGSGRDGEQRRSPRGGRGSGPSEAVQQRAELRLRRAVTELEGVKQEAAELRRVNRRLAVELERTEAQVVSLTEDRTRAVRQLKAVEASLAERVAESRRHRDEAAAARSELAEALDALARATVEADGPTGGPGSDVTAPTPTTAGADPASPPVDLHRAARTVAEAAEAAGRMADALATLAGVLVPEAPTTPGASAAAAGTSPAPAAPAVAPRAASARTATDWPAPASPLARAGRAGGSSPGDRPSAAVGGPRASPGDDEDQAGSSTTSGSARRRAVRLARGAVDDTATGAEGLARLAGVVFLVDGYNVSKTGWPELDLGAQRLRLVNAVAELRVRLGTQVELVFDGNAEGRSFTRALPADVRVWFSPEDIEADDLILSLVDEQPPERPVVVVSSDRRVQEGAGRRGASVLSSPTFLCLLR